ncbi:MAG: zinc-ribbon and DUF3426 domain-containing protein [Steroidobacteraceae bacterium]
MFTTCPACRMNLAVTPSDLRIGQGYVRCGRCNRVFNALQSLAEDLDQDEQSGLAATGTTTVPAMEDPGEYAPANDTAEPPAAQPKSDEESNWARITPVDVPAMQEVDVVERQSTGTFETIVLEGDGYLQTEEHVDEQDVDAQLQELARQMDSRNADAGQDGADRVHPDENIVLEVLDDSPRHEFETAASFDPPRRRHHRAWAVVAAVLALLLFGQLLHHSRQILVAYPWFERPLQSLYALFGVTLTPRWDLQAYDLRQLGAESPAGASDRIVLRATVHNRGPISQPPPMIRVVLKDRFENTLSTAAVAPADYLQTAVPARMAPDQRLDIMLTLPDPTRQAAGFEIDACLPGADGKLHCSNDP